MTPLVERVHQKIMQAYGPQSQILTTIDIAAMAYSLSQHCVDKCRSLSKTNNKPEYEHYLKLHSYASCFITSVYEDVTADDQDMMNLYPQKASADDLVAWLASFQSSTDPHIVAYRERKNGNGIIFQIAWAN